MADVYGDGTVYFARTLDEHNANVNKYLYGNS
jgi:cell division protein YceG involved in septum cleavage